VEKRSGAEKNTSEKSCDPIYRIKVEVHKVGSEGEGQNTRGPAIYYASSLLTHRSSIATVSDNGKRNFLIHSSWDETDKV